MRNDDNLITNDNSITVEVVNGPSAIIPWAANMNAQQAIEAAYAKIGDSKQFTYALQYYGAEFGYLVLMINGTYDTSGSFSHPYFYWDFLVNGQSAGKGIDGTILNAGDVVSFRYDLFSPVTHAGSTLQAKRDFHNQEST